MSNKPWRSMLFGDANLSFRRSLSTYCGMLTIIVGVVLILNGVSGESTIDIRTSFIQGQLQSGSIGILFSFFGFMILVISHLHQTKSKLELKRLPDGTLIINHKGSLTAQKAKTIRLLMDDNTTDHRSPPPQSE